MAFAVDASFLANRFTAGLGCWLDRAAAAFGLGLTSFFGNDLGDCLGYAWSIGCLLARLAALGGLGMRLYSGSFLLVLASDFGSVFDSDFLGLDFELAADFFCLTIAATN